jgi:hypothetical protein
MSIFTLIARFVFFWNVPWSILFGFPLIRQVLYLFLTFTYIFTLDSPWLILSESCSFKLLGLPLHQALIGQAKLSLDWWPGDSLGLAQELRKPKPSDQAMAFAYILWDFRSIFPSQICIFLRHVLPVLWC